MILFSAILSDPFPVVFSITFLVDFVSFPNALSVLHPVLAVSFSEFFSVALFVAFLVDSGSFLD